MKCAIRTLITALLLAGTASAQKSMSLSSPMGGPSSQTSRPEDLMNREEAHRNWGLDAQKAVLAKNPRGLMEPFTFAIVGDAEIRKSLFKRVFSGNGESVFEKMMATVNRSPHDFVLQLGDFVDRGTDKNYARFIKQLDRLARRPFFPLVGNHDREEAAPYKWANRILYQQIFSSDKVPYYRNTDFYIDHGGYRIVCLDNADGEISAMQLKWLDSVLNAERITIVAMHMPPAYLHGRWTRPQAGPDKTGKTNPEHPSFIQGYFEKGAQRFSEIVSLHKVERVYVGHIHALAYSDYAGVRYVLSGGASPAHEKLPGMDSYPSHYLRVKAGPGGIHETVVPVKGDEFELGG